MPQRDDDYEPVFKKSNWGTGRYIYNPDNPLGMGLIILSAVSVLVMMFLMQERKGPFEPPKETPWSPPADHNPTFPWGENHNATPFDRTTPSPTP